MHRDSPEKRNSSLGGLRERRPLLFVLGTIVGSMACPMAGAAFVYRFVRVAVSRSSVVEYSLILTAGEQAVVTWIPLLAASVSACGLIVVLLSLAASGTRRWPVWKRAILAAACTASLGISLTLLGLVVWR